MKARLTGQSDMAKMCKLTRPEVLALRFYTTLGFKNINDPLRDTGRKERNEAHPLPVMVFLLWCGVKKLRTFAAKSSTALDKIDLFRGMSNVQLESGFLLRGGTELAPMSTTKDLTIAIKYASTGSHSVLLRVRTTGFMTLGAQLRWLSAFPFEEEYLYPPTTFLKILRAKPHVFKIGTATFHVVDVLPELP